MLDIRLILSRNRIEWKDTGSNTSKGWVNICCPFCAGMDPSYHCRISDQGTGFYCLRSTLHKGSIWKLFKKLDIPTDNLPKGLASVEDSRPERASKMIDDNTYRTFLPAVDSPEILAYLEARKFLLPREVATRFALKYSPRGKWAGRLIIPLTAGWTGRAVRSHLNPRYLSETDESGFFLHGSGHTAILVEGPIDALKLAAVHSGFLFIAMTGGRVSPSLLFTLRARRIQRLFAAPDANIELPQRVLLIQQLRGHCPEIDVIDTQLPHFTRSDGEEVKDAGALTEQEARAWLYSVTK